MPLLTISQSAFDEVARAIREAVPADEHDAYFDGDGRVINMDMVEITTEGVAFARALAREAMVSEEARKPPFQDYVPSED